MIIVKIGGGAGINLEGIVQGLAQIPEPFLVVHGANALRNQLAQQLGISVQTLTSVSGYSSVYSDPPLMDVLIMAYAGLRNKRLVELFQQQGRNAIGLSGLDGSVIQGRRNRGIRIKQQGKTIIRRDLSGKPFAVNQALLEWLLQNQYVPVLTVPILDEHGTAINSENDDIVAVLQRALNASRVWHFIEAPGILQDPRDEQSLIPALNREQLHQFLQSSKGRMQRKIRSLLQLLDQGVKEIVVTDGRVTRPVQLALNHTGTVIS